MTILFGDEVDFLDCCKKKAVGRVIACDGFGMIDRDPFFRRIPPLHTRYQ